MSWARAELGCLAFAVLGVGLVWPSNFESRDEPRVPTWTKVGKDGSHCASCHTPTGHEIWGDDIPLADIQRRARRHLESSDIEALTKEVENARARPHLVLSGFSLRGGLPSLAGKTMSEKDQSFGNNFPKIQCDLVGVKVHSATEARAFLRNACSYPLDYVPVAFDINPLSRDPIRPTHELGFADWIPDIGMSDKGTRVMLNWQEKGQPGGLAGLKKAINLAEGQPKSVVEALARLKRIALIERDIANQTGSSVEPPLLTQSMPTDPIWAVADFARETNVTTAESLGITAEQAKLFGVSATDPLDFNPMAMSWMWVSWATDPTLQKVSLDRKAKNGSYFGQTLWKLGPLAYHSLYFFARRPAEEYFSGSPNKALQPELNALVSRGALDPFAGDSRFRQACRNLWRLDTLVLVDDLEHGKMLENAVAANQQLDVLYFFAYGQEQQGDALLLRARLKRLLEPLMKKQTIH